MVSILYMARSEGFNKGEERGERKEGRGKKKSQKEGRRK
jgi:hypothetical protein